MKNAEKHMLRRIADGESKAFEELFFAYQPKLVCFMVSLTHDEEVSRDMAQELFLCLWRDREKLREVGSIGAYLYRMARCRVYDYFDHLIVMEKYAADFLEETSEDCSEEELIFMHELQQIVNRVVESLPPQQQTVYKLSREKGLSNSEIAERLGISKRTVENHLSAVLSLLRRVLLLIILSN